MTTVVRMDEPRVVLPSLVMGESVRRHDGRVWLADWGRGEIIRVEGDRPEVVVRVAEPRGPLCFDWLPDGRMVRVEGPRLVLAEGTYAELGHIDADHPWNDVTVDPRGNVFVNNIGYAFGAEDPRPGLLAVVAPDGTARAVADGLEFPNGMAVTADGTTLIVAESHAGRLTAFDIAADGSLGGRRAWAEMPGSAPDGICLDPSGALWYADVPNRQCVRVAEGGKVLDTVGFDRGAFDCVVDGGVLWAAIADYTDPEMFTSATGRLVAVRV